MYIISCVPICFAANLSFELFHLIMLGFLPFPTASDTHLYPCFVLTKFNVGPY